MQPAPSLKDMYPHKLKDLRELSQRGELTFVGRIGDSLYAQSQTSYPLVLFKPLPSVPTIEYEGSDSSGEPGVPLQEVCTSLHCLTGVHKTENAAKSRLSRLLSGSVPPVIPPSAPATGGMIAPVQTTQPGGEIRNPDVTTSSPPIVINTPRASNPLPAIDAPRPSAEVGALSHYKNPLLTGVIGLLILAWVFAKRVGEKWRSSVASKESALEAQRDLGLQEIVIPVKPVAPPTVSIPLEIVESKPLPPVPPPDTPSDTPNEEPEDDAEPDGEETEKEGDASGKKKKASPRAKPRRKRGQGGRKKVTLDLPPEEPQALVSGITVASTQQVSAPNVEPSQLMVSETVLGTWYDIWE